MIIADGRGRPKSGAALVVRDPQVWNGPAGRIQCDLCDFSSMIHITTQMF
uniref:Uncharacterized protein n=1 Tax=Candidatus Kentrum sp. SD TaxID=2126332 RepID=A0A451BPA6_9GAMM|nr:MAG: hypothetical protein BECKSD772D_GA0070982_10853 [Candidatus Kentron sp. SD]